MDLIKMWYMQLLNTSQHLKWIKKKKKKKFSFCPKKTHFGFRPPLMKGLHPLQMWTSVLQGTELP